MRQINLFMALVWLILGVGMLVRPDLIPLQLQPFYLQMAVFAAVMCFYNVMRWWLMRLQRRYLEQEDETWLRRRRRPKPIDPTFDLSEDERGSQEERPGP